MRVVLNLPSHLITRHDVRENTAREIMMTLMDRIEEDHIGEERLGETIDGRYRLERVLGAGASGVVYAATQIAVERTVAIKLLHDANDSDFQARFELEARAVARLNHKNCITMHDFGFWDARNTYFLVTEYIGGERLSDRMMDLMPVDFVLSIILDVAQALNHAHAAGVLHRDLKPENIMLVKTDQRWESAKVLDFGLARILDSGNSRLTPIAGLPVIGREQMVHGTPIYMSPEQCQNVNDLTGAADIYALGVIAFELIEGRVPFDGKTTEEVCFKHVRSMIPPMTNPNVGPAMIALIRSMLAKDPIARPSAREVIDLLRGQISIEVARDGWENEEFVFEEVDEASSAEWELHELPPTRAHRIPLYTGAAFVFFLVLFGVGWAMSGNDDEAQKPDEVAASTVQQTAAQEPSLDVPSAVSTSSEAVSRAVSIAQTASTSVPTAEPSIDKKPTKKPTSKPHSTKKNDRSTKLRALKLSL